MSGIILAGDVGGTKTHLALYRGGGGELLPLRDALYPTAEFASLQDACAHFLASDEHVTAACFGVPGPILDGRAHATNVPWVMDERRLKEAIGAEVLLVNDLAATAMGVVHLPRGELCELQPGRELSAPANVAVIAAGTGLGEAALAAGPRGYYTVASEGGHCDFAPRGEEQQALLRFLHREFDHVSVERVLSGPGLFNIYRFLRETTPTAEPEWLGARLKAEDPAAVVSESALDERDPRCVHALELFVEIYGAEASNLALKVLAYGGVYLGGGIAPKILPRLKDGRFVRAFRAKGRLDQMLSMVRVCVSLNEAAALLGAAHLAAQML